MLLLRDGKLFLSYSQIPLIVAGVCNLIRSLEADHGEDRVHVANKDLLYFSRRADRD